MCNEILVTFIRYILAQRWILHVIKVRSVDIAYFIVIYSTCLFEYQLLAYRKFSLLIPLDKCLFTKIVGSKKKKSFELYYIVWIKRINKTQSAHSRMVERLHFFNLNWTRSFFVNNNCRRYLSADWNRVATFTVAISNTRLFLSVCRFPSGRIRRLRGRQGLLRLSRLRAALSDR